MVQKRKFSLTLAVFAIFGLCGGVRTMGQTSGFPAAPVRLPPAEGGRLTNSDGDSKGFPRGASAGTLTLRKDVSGTCDPRPPKANMQIRELRRNLNLDIAQLGIVVQPARKDVVLHKFWLEIYSGDRLVFKTLPDCTGCSRTYKGIVPSGAKPSGYVFTLDEEARALASRFFVPENRITLKVSGHNGVVTSFYVVKVD